MTKDNDKYAWMNHMKAWELVAIIIACVIIIAGLYVLYGAALMFLWNQFVVPITDATEINLGQGILGALSISVVVGLVRKAGK